jgi:hypothetical protein
MKKFLLAAGCVGACSTIALAGPKKLHQSGPGVMLTPVRIAPINADGSIGEWREYAQPVTVCTDTLTFDCAQLGSLCTSPVPVGGVVCGIGEGSRWFFGPSYNNPLATNDMTVDVAGTINDATGSWFQGGTLSRPALQIHRYYESDAIVNEDGVAAVPIQQTDTSFIGGVIYDFGIIPPGGAYYYYFWSDDLCTGGGICDPTPANGAGAYSITVATSDGVDIFLDTTPGSQPMLWGTEGGGSSDRPGTQNTFQWDDDNLPDGTYSSPTELYTYSFGLCPDPLGALIGLWVKGGAPCAEDCTGDGLRDAADLALLLSCYNGGPCCDITGDGGTGAADLAALLAVYNIPCP